MGQSATPCCSTRICGRGYKSLLRCAIERPFRMVTRIEMLSATSILSSASGGIESDLSNESLHFFSVGTRRFSSSNQFSTTLICVGAACAAASRVSSGPVVSGLATDTLAIMREGARDRSRSSSLEPYCYTGATAL